MEGSNTTAEEPVEPSKPEPVDPNEEGYIAPIDEKCSMCGESMDDCQCFADEDDYSEDDE